MGFLYVFFIIASWRIPLPSWLKEDHASGFVPSQELVSVSWVQTVSEKTPFAEGSSFGRVITRPNPCHLLNLNGKIIVWIETILLYIDFPWLSISDGVTGLKELAFLRDLAEQNSGKYGVLDRTALPVVKGSMMVLNQLSNLETTVGRFYTNLPNRMIDEAVFSLPFSDEMGDGEFGKNLLL